MRLNLRAVTFAGLIVYLLLLHRIFVTMIMPEVRDNAPGLGWLLVSAAITLVPALWMRISLHRPSQVPYWFLYLSIVLPCSFIPLYTLELEPRRIVGLTAMIVGSFVATGLFYRLPLIRFPRPEFEVSAAAFWLVLGFLSFGLYTVIFGAFGFEFHLPGLSEVYEVRAEYTLAAHNHGRFVAYAIGWQANTINPLLIVWGVVRRNPLTLALGVAGQLAVYSITAFKSVLFTPFLIVAVLPLLAARGRRFGAGLVAGVITMIGSLMVLDHLRNSGLMTSLITRRLLTIPALLTGYYYDFFRVGPKALLADGILRPFFEYPYSFPKPYLIGVNYFGSTEAHTNANVWADGYANFGIAGLFLMPMAMGAVFWVIDSASVGADYRLACLLLVPHAFTLANSGLLTVLVTHGFALTVVFMYLLPRVRSRQEMARISSAARHPRMSTAGRVRSSLGARMDRHLPSATRRGSS